MVIGTRTLSVQKCVNLDLSLSSFDDAPLPSASSAVAASCDGWHSCVSIDCLLLNDTTVPRTGWCSHTCYVLPEDHMPFKTIGVLLSKGHKNSTVLWKWKFQAQQMFQDNWHHTDDENRRVCL